MPRNNELIRKIELLESGELIVFLAGSGQPSYQYVYREARGVYWDGERSAFKFAELGKWSKARTFGHIVDVCSSCGIKLRLKEEVDYAGLSLDEISGIRDWVSCDL